MTGPRAACESSGTPDDLHHSSGAKNRDHRAGQDPLNPPSPPRTEPYKTHLAYVKERRTEADGAAILDEALARLRGR